MDEMREVMPTLLTLIDEHVIDPRREHAQRYPLCDIVAVAVLATLCGAEGYDEICDWGMANQEWLAEYLSLEHGVPPEACIRRVFGALDTDDIADLFVAITEVLARGDESHICIDGKAVRGSLRRPNNEQPLMLLNAWGHERRLVLAQRVIDPSQNETSTLPRLLESLALKGTTVTMDAVNSHVSATELLRDAGADYVLPVKKNQPALLSELEQFFREQSDPGLQPRQKLKLVFDEQTDAGHGRVEVRRLYAYEGKALRKLVRLSEFRDVRTVLRLQRERILGDKVTHETALLISSLPGKTPQDAAHLNRTIRQHWGVENKLHWVLDVILGEDACRVHNRRAAANLAIIRRMVLNLVRHEPSAGSRVSLKRRRFRANCDRRYLAAILAQALAPEVHDR